MRTTSKLWSEQPASAPELPEPTVLRWRPLRSGILQIYQFDQQEFWYEQGRLLLRGNNGAGKSRVLALQLPFLLDGELAPHRLEPDRDPAKRMEWNLLMKRLKDRRGYTWIEFGRRDDSGQAHYYTIGCGLQAVEGRGITSHWFFTTSRRPGRDLQLQTANGHPFTREQLADHFGNEGEVYTTSREYRRAVDQMLFALDDHRYKALVDLLITLRQPQLSKTLDEEALSQALSDALPPVSQRLIDDVAESLRGLEVDREQLDANKASAEAVRLFLETYARYACMASRRKVDAVHQAHSQFESTCRQLNKAEEQHRDAATDLKAVDDEISGLRRDEVAAEAAREALLSSPQMAAAGELKQAREVVAGLKGDVERASEQVQKAAQRCAELLPSLQNAEAALQKAQESSASLRTVAVERAAPIGLQEAHQRVVNVEALVEPRDVQAIARARDEMSKVVESRRRDIKLVRGACEEADAAGEVLAKAREEHEARVAECESAESAVAEAESEIEAAIAKALAQYRTWRGGLVELQPDEPALLGERLHEWAQTGDGEGPLAAAAQAAALASAERVAGEVSSVRSEIAQAGIAKDELEGERVAVMAGRHEPPPAPHTRAANRLDQTGAPLWSLFDFHESLAAQDRAGIEAALEGAGLLDAWVLPSGTVLDPETLDTIITADAERVPRGTQSLAAVLRPASVSGPEPGVERTVVEGILRSIALGPGQHRTGIGMDGSWRNGVLSGRWSKSSAEHIGPAAREARRQRRLAELDERIAEVVERLQGLDRRLIELDERRGVATEEAAAAPREDGIRDALAAATAARRRLNESRTEESEAALGHESARQKYDAALNERNAVASDLRLQDWVDRLDELNDHLTSYGEALSDLWLALERYRGDLQATDLAKARDRDADEALSASRERLEQLSGRYSAAKARLNVLEQSEGAGAEEVMDALEQATVRLNGIRETKEAADRRRTTAIAAEAEVKGRIGDLRTKRSEHQDERDRTVESFRRFIGTGLLAIALPTYVSGSDPISLTRLVELAREFQQVLPDVPPDPSAWDRQQGVLFEQFKVLEDSLLQYDHRPSLTPEGDVLVVRTTFQGRSCAIDDLLHALEGEVEERQMLLDAREREILENHLIGEVAQHLHDCLRSAEQLIPKMNAELARVPTSSGMILRFRWEPKDDGPPGLREIRKRLLGAVGTWTEQEREAVGRFLQERIKAERIANDTGTWQAHLADAFDYRSWHNFVVERNIDGQWQRLTRRTHGTASTGEKAVALMVPMFAAAAAHYRSASPLSPRLILLDEAFAGVDPGMRARCAGLLAAFDLDFIMTSESEWCCYAGLPGVAICHLSSRQGVYGVYVSRFVWNGRERRLAPMPLAPEFGSQAEHHNRPMSDGESGA